MSHVSLCAFCKHLGTDKSRPLYCAAFPDGIPEALFNNDPPHFDPAPGDHGIQFEMRTDLDAEGRRVALKVVEMLKGRRGKAPAAAG